MTQSERGSVTSREQPSRDRQSNSQARLSEQAQMRLGNHLRAMYDAVVQQPVPDHLSELIARLRDDGDAAPVRKT